MALTEEARQLRNQKAREWRKNHPGKQKEYYENWLNRQAEKLKKEQEAEAGRKCTGKN